ncbi:MAG TPA: carbohydrate porin [Chitinophagaceae bacterium]|nr:carbohydrate porin [Chitinophagaceae bacterium]
MKQLTLLYLAISFFCAAYAQTPYAQTPVVHHNLFTALKEKGVTFGISESLEGYYNFTGGIRSGSAYASTFDANMNIDLQKLIGFRGATFYVDLEDHAGDNPTNTLTGDWQVFDKHNASPFLQVLEIWYQQELFDRKLRVKVGKIDANTEFSVIDNGLEFINSSTQVTPTLFVFPTFPDPVPSINIFFTPGKLFYTSFAIDDANQRAGFLNFYGDPTSVQPTTDGALLLSESGLTWDHLPVSGKDGNLKLGLWKHSGNFSKFDGHTRHGAEGFYLIADQTLWEPESQNNENRGLRMYLEYTRTDSTVSPVYEHFGGGVEWAGPSANRPHDATGFGVHYVALSPGLHLPKQNEINLETFYKFLITPWLNIKPDIQYIIHPGGQYKNVVIGTLLLDFAFNS